jgi:hypothetical protein
MNWGVEDFGAAAALLIGAGLALTLVFRRVRGPISRVVLAGGVVLVALAIWAHLAVGIF